VPTKSGLMVGLGETDEEILEVMREMRAHDVDMLTIGQYLAAQRPPPAGAALRAPRHLQDVRGEAAKMGFSHAAVGAMVRSSYHADQQAAEAGVSNAVGDPRSRSGPRRPCRAWPPPS
jgi:lipoyl synthase